MHETSDIGRRVCDLALVSAFVSGKTWTDLLQEWRAFSAPARPKDLKGWLADKYNVKVSKRMVESALTGAVPHHDLLALAETIRSASGQ